MLHQFTKGKTAVFVDAANIFYSQKTLRWNVSYELLKKYLEKECELVDVFVYTATGTDLPKQEKFLAMLKRAGYTVRTKDIKKIKSSGGASVWKCNFDVEMAMDMLDALPQYQTAVLLSGDSDFAPILERLKSHGKRVIVMSVKGHVSKELLDSAKYINMKKLRSEIELVEVHKKIPPHEAGRGSSDRIINDIQNGVKPDVSHVTHVTPHRRPVTYHLTQQSKGSLARVGEIHTPHGVIKTPCFVPVGTKATVKGIDPSLFRSLGMQVLIANGYHLYLNPGEKIVDSMGGVAKFMGWNGPTMTDSGGFQVFSLGVAFGKEISKIAPSDISPDAGVAPYSEELASEHGKLAIVDDDGVTFTSHVNGSLHRFTPERSIEIQHGLGADIIFAFDEFIVPTAPEADQRESMERTHAWAKRSLAAHRRNFEKNKSQGIFGIVQGGRFNNLREESARFMADMDFDGYGIGGTLTKADLLGMLDVVNNILPAEKPRHLLGIGEPEDMFIGVEGGIDTFDCVLPTKNGRTGKVFTYRGKMNITRSEFQFDGGPLCDGCDCPVCTQYTRSYIHHLFRSNEMLGGILATRHNLYFIVKLVNDMREALLQGNFAELRETFMREYEQGTR